MGRPAKNSCDYFPHDRDMRDHKKVKAIRSKFGITGYAVWSMMLEYLTGSDGNEFEYSDMEFEIMSGDFGISATEIRSIVDYCISLEMLFNRNGFIHSESLDERLAPVYQKRGKAKELSKKQLRKNGKFTSNNADESVVSVAEKPQSKVKESKGEQSKEDQKEENENFIFVDGCKIFDPLQTIEFYEAQLNGMQRENNNLAWRPMVSKWFAQHIGECFTDGNHVKNSFKKFYLTAPRNGKVIAERNIDHL